MVIAGGLEATTEIEKDCDGLGLNPLVRVTVPEKVPVWVGVPDNTPAEDKVRPGGREPAVTLMVGVGVPPIWYV